MTEPAAASLARAKGNGGQDRQPPRKASPRAPAGLADSSKKLPVAYRTVNLTWDGLTLRLRASERVLAVLKSDPAHPSLYRVCALDYVSELLNLTRAKDAAVSFALAALNGEVAIKRASQTAGAVMSDQCPQCGVAGVFGYHDPDNGPMIWYCDEHRPSKHYADKRGSAGPVMQGAVEVLPRQSLEDTEGVIVSELIKADSTDTMQLPALAGDARAKLPETYEKAKQALAACADLDECKDWADKAAATAAYARMAEDRTLVNYAHRIQARAVRQIGELIKLIPSAQGQRPPNGVAPTKSPKEQARIAAGLSKDQVNTAVRVANIPKESFEEQVEATNPPTVTELARQGTQHRPQRADAQPVEENATAVLAQEYIAAVVDLLRMMPT